MTAEEILTDIRTMLTEIIGVEYALSLDIGMDTSFDADLQLESIEFVKLSTMLTDYYGDRIDFVSFLADKTLNEIIALQVGEVVDYIAGGLIPAGALDG
ncbi:MAG TPA: phosphopantetheine-binding protein [Pseudonocardiaceae bacterium]|nr:phosphopantetheine-binding protein [Pseudonocardiaceae bacterium]